MLLADDTSKRSNSFPVAADGTSKSSGSVATNHTKLDGAIQHESLRSSPWGRASAHSRLSVPDLRRGNHSAHQGDEALDRHLAPPTTARNIPSIDQQRTADRPLIHTVLARTKLHPTPRNKADLHSPNIRLLGVESGPGECHAQSKTRRPNADVTCRPGLRISGTVISGFNETGLRFYLKLPSSGLSEFWVSSSFS
jgi:hypothetical protein